MVLCLLFSTIWTIPHITFGYNRTEEYAALFMLISYYIISKYFICDDKYDKNDKYEKFALIDIFIIGIMAGLTFMTNIRAVILFVPFAFAIAICTIKNEKSRATFYLIKLFVCGLLGVLVSMIPYIIYMLLTDSVADMIDAVFYANFAYLNSDIEKSVDVFSTVINFIKENIIFYIVCFISIIMMLFKSKTNIFLLISTLISFIIANYYIFFGGRVHVYYLVILMPYLIVIPIILCEIFIICFTNNNVYKYICFVMLLFFTFIHIFCYHKSLYNRYLNCLSRSNNIKNELLKIYGNSADKLDSLNILAFGTNPEVYEYIGVRVLHKYFFIPLISYDCFKEPYDYQYNELVHCRPDVIIYREGPTTNDFPIEKKNQIKYTLNHKYEFVKKIDTNGIEGSYLIYVKFD